MFDCRNTTKRCKISRLHDDGYKLDCGVICIPKKIPETSGTSIDINTNINGSDESKSGESRMSWYCTNNHVADDDHDIYTVDRFFGEIGKYLEGSRTSLQRLSRRLGYSYSYSYNYSSKQTNNDNDNDKKIGDNKTITK